MGGIEKRLLELGIELPDLPKPNGFYQTWVIDGGLLSTSGQLSRDGDSVICGRLAEGDDLDIAREAARICTLRCLSIAHDALSDLDAIERIISVRGYVAAEPEFKQHSKVLDAASELLVKVFGDVGKHVRTAIGVSSLPSSGLVEIELVARIRGKNS